MFLAIKEIKHEKLRSGLIISMIVLISYLIFILSSLALGLARENTDAINSWGIESITLDKDSDVSMRQSLISADQVGHLPNTSAYIGQASVVAKAKTHANISAVFLGLESKQFVAKGIKLSEGHRPTKNHEVIADESFANAGYQLGDKIKLNDDSTAYTIVGLTRNAKLNVAPVLYGDLSDWSGLRQLTSGPIASAVVSKKASFKPADSQLKTYSTASFIQKLPGYSDQNMTFGLMIGFLMVISLIIIAVFLYILTIQKLPNFAVLRAQGVPRRVLVMSTLSQSLLLVATGLVIGIVLTIVTAVLLPTAVPMAFDIPALTLVGLGVLMMGLIGGLIPIRSVLKLDPVSVIGG